MSLTVDVLLLIPLPLITHPVPLTPLLPWNEMVESEGMCGVLFLCDSWPGDGVFTL